MTWPPRWRTMLARTPGARRRARVVTTAGRHAVRGRCRGLLDARVDASAAPRQRGSGGGDAACRRSPEHHRRRGPVGRNGRHRRQSVTETEGERGEGVELRLLTLKTMVGSRTPEDGRSRRDRRVLPPRSEKKARNDDDTERPPLD